MYEHEKKGATLAVIVGIDPGSRVLGFGVITQKSGKLVHLDHGIIDVSRHDLFSTRIRLIGEGLGQLLEKHKPDCVVVEKIFMGKNVDSAFKLGHARGVCLYEAARQNLPIFEYESRVVKKGITGSGAATKDQVRLMILSLLGITSDQALDATDALSMAVYHSRMNETREQFLRLKIDPPSDLGEAL